MMKFSTYGDWAKAGVVLRGLSKTGSIRESFKRTLKSDGEMIKDKLVNHIIMQDLGWKPLSPHTVILKGHSKIYLETYSLVRNLSVRPIKAPHNGYAVYIGAHPSSKNVDGTKLSDVMKYLEYGTRRIPARPLIRPTWNEVKDKVRAHMKNTLRGYIRSGIGGKG